MIRALLLIAPALAGASIVLQAQTHPPAFPRTNATKLLETERIVVWDIVWPKGQPTPLHRHVYDQVGTYYQPGGRVITSVDGTKRETTTATGALSRTRRGTTHIEEGITDPPLRAVFIELKADTPAGEPPGPRDIQPALPVAGDAELHDDERVTVWDRTWRELGRPSYGKYYLSSIWVFLTDGALDVTPQGGAPSRLTVAPGQIRHVKAGTVETVRAVRGSPRAMIFSFK